MNKSKLIVKKSWQKNVCQWYWRCHAN